MTVSAGYDVDVRDVEYLRHGDLGLMASVFQPRGSGPFPLLVEVHGGAWTMGDRTSNQVMNEAIARMGTVVVAIDFRQPPVAGYPASLQDINYAIRWAKANASTLNARTERVGLYGSSSGGHQVVLAAMRPADARYAALPLAGDTDASVDYLIMCWPIVDPLARYQYARDTNNTRLIESHDAFWGSEAAMAEGNPQLILEQGVIHTGPLPDALIIQGTADGNIPYHIVERFAETYRQAGGKVQLELYQDEPHGFIRQGTPASEQATAQILEFVRAQTA